MTITLSPATREQARALRARSLEADREHELAVRRYAYGNGTFKSTMDTLDRVNAIWRELLALHGMTEEQWLWTPETERRILWGL